jgi:hypothetical protein
MLLNDEMFPIEIAAIGDLVGNLMRRMEHLSNMNEMLSAHLQAT